MSFKCLCGNITNTIKYKNGIRCCEICSASTLSGVWERNNAMERSKYAKDILQKGQAGFNEVYGSKIKNK